MKTRTFKIDNYKVVIKRKEDPKSNGGTTVHIFEDSSKNILMGWNELYDVKESSVLIRASKSIEKHMQEVKGMNHDLIKNWYLEHYPTDDEGENINDTVTFTDLYDMLLSGNGDIYKLIGVADSIIRERLFENLVYLKDVEYEVIYKLWLALY